MNLTVVASEFVHRLGAGAFAYLNERAEIARMTGDIESAITWWDIALIVVEDLNDKSGPGVGLT